MPRRGRPSDYTEELATAICDRITAGEPLTQICEDKGMPTRTTVCNWRHAHPEFLAMYARARRRGDVWAERALQVALRADPATANASRLKWDALKWYASKLAPKTYGDKMQHTGDGGGAINLIVETGVRRSSDDDDDDATP